MEHETNGILKRYGRASVTSVVLVLVVGSVALAQSKKSEDMANEIAAMQEKMKRVATPGPEHERLGFFVGKWDVQGMMVMPGAPAQSFALEADCQWLIDGRWLGERLEGSMFGAPYEAFHIRGFDNYAKNHVVATVSSMDTALNVSRGTVVDPEGKVAAFYGFLDEYTTDELHKPYKSVSKIVDRDTHVLEVWDFGIGESGAKVLEFTYRRKR